MKLFLALPAFLLFLVSCGGAVTSKTLKAGDAMDSLNNVKVYFNESFSNVSGRNVVDGYNIGLKYQCVEFVKRYYFEYYQHRMPNSYGHAKDFFMKGLEDGKINNDRGLRQYSNPSFSRPKVGDLIVFDESIFNSFGHVAIVSEVRDDQIEIIQQNTSRSRDWIDLKRKGDQFYLDDNQLLGWLRK